MPTIKTLKARQILDSRGTPTVEVDCTLSDGSFGRAAVPSGASTGSHEALELRDGDEKLYGGKSVIEAVTNVDGILAALKGMDVSDQREVDGRMIKLDGTLTKTKLGANAILGVSMAVCRARAASEKLPLYRSLARQFSFTPHPSSDGGGEYLLPVPLMNVLNGGKHADSGLSLQECMIVPCGFPKFSDALRAGVEIFTMLKKLLHAAGHITAVGDEGGFAPRVKDSMEAFSFLARAIEEAGYGAQVKLAIDAAATSFFGNGVYTIDGKKLSSKELTKFYADLCERYPIVSIEDSHAEEDWEGFEDMQKTLGKKIQLVGDDLLVTNVRLLERAIKEKAANAILIKLNQIGTVTETVDAVQLAQKSGWRTIVSHRSGETEDTFIADFAVAMGTGQIKTGSASRTDRVCKYNQLLRIEEELGNKAQYQSPF